MNNKFKAKIRVNGKVQGVWFRAFTHDRATELGLTGWVQNETDGTVYLEVEGNKPKLELLMNELKAGPERSFVDDVEVDWTSAEDQWKEFTIRY